MVVDEIIKKRDKHECCKAIHLQTLVKKSEQKNLANKSNMVGTVKTWLCFMNKK